MKPYLFAAAALAASPALAQQVLNLRDADIRAFIQDAARVTGRTFVIDQRVTGKVSVVTDRPLSRSEYFEVFLSTLRANGLVAVPIGRGAYRIQPSEGAATQATRVGSSGAARNAFVTEVLRLRSGDATTLVDTIRPLVSREGSVTANRNGNSLVIADYADNIRRIREVVRRLDGDATQSRVIPLRNAGVREVATSLTLLAQSDPRGQIAIVPVDSSNSIVLRGDAASISRYAAVIADLDRRAAAGSEIRVIFLENADAEKLLPVLQQLVGQSVSVTPTVVGGNPATPRLPGASSPAAAAAASDSGTVTTVGGGGGRGGAVIARYEGANAIIISAPADVQRTLGEVIRQLDTRREQVLVEAIIVEISDTAAKRLGVQILLGNLKGGAFAATNYSNAAPNILNIAGAIGARQLATTTTTVNGTTTTTTTNNAVSDQLAQAAVSSILGAAGGFGGFGGQSGNTIFGAILNAVSQDNTSNILSTPSVVTLDNQEAKILVGQEIPVTTGEALSGNFDNAFRTVQRQNVGIQLEVKPQVNTGGAIKLFLRQEVSSIAGPVTNNSADLILNKREIQTTVTVDDGQIIALGGLLDDNERRTLEKIPLLGDIPVLGNLFRSKARSRNKTNLMVFIRPTILRSAADAKALAERRYGFIRGTQLANNPDREPSIDELLRDYMGIEPPVPEQIAPPPETTEPVVIQPRVQQLQVPVPATPKKRR